MVGICLHAANVLYLTSFLTRDMLWLRVLTCAGLVLGVAFFACQPIPLYGCMAWHVLFLFINGYQIRRLVVERRQLMLTGEQAWVGEATFHDLSRDELLTLLTRVTCAAPKRLPDVRQASQAPLTPDERALRDIAFSRLSRKEILNLLTRRMWNSITRLNPVRWGRRRRPDGPTAPTVRTADVA